MNKRFFSIVTALCGILMGSAGQIRIDDSILAVSGSATMEIALSNERTDFVAFQMDLLLPEGVGIDKTGCTLSSRFIDKEQELVIGKLESGAYRLTSTSLSLTPINGTSGTLLTLQLTTTEGCVGGQASISNIRFSTSGSERVFMDDVSFIINTQYTLTYNVDGEEYKTTTIAYGTALTPEAEPTKEGYTFSGWSEIPKTMPAKDVTVTGSFTVNSYNLTYVVDGEEYKTTAIAYGTALTPEAEPTKEGYTFSGWSEIPKTMPAKDVTVTGSFTVNSYKVTFKYGNEVLTTEMVDYGSEIPLPESLNSDRYTLIEWLDVPEMMPAHDITIQAAYTDGVRSVENDKPIMNHEFYQLNGVKHNKLQRGINIIHTSDGKTRNVLVR